MQIFLIDPEEYVPHVFTLILPVVFAILTHV